ncbi:MAG TPA: tetratricopeptide repeat protein [Candidatus Methylacidiphilales bacterium]|nr:tetratricopeptide repeat protein [Candidatus Methylacidiphilales bacterium]
MAIESTRKKTAGGDVAMLEAGQAAPASPRPERLQDDWTWGLLLALAVLATYLPVLHAGFIWDDDVFVTNNPCIIGPLGLKEIWTTNAADICPLTLTTVWFEHALWGSAPLPYHLANVLLHAACAALLWRVLLSLQVPGAWLGAALWALHPVQVESVAWVTEIKNTQSGLFFLLSILFFVRGLRAESPHPEGRTGDSGDYALTLFFAALAMASKSSTVVLPVVLCLCAWRVESRWRWNNLAKAAPVFLLSVIACALSLWTQAKPLQASNDPIWRRTFSERLATAGDAVWFYLGKLIWPHPLMMLYPQWQIDAGQWFAYLPALAALIILFVLWFKRDLWPGSAFFAFAYFLITLLPVLGFVNMGFFQFSFVTDHFQYLASMGVMALTGAGLIWLLDPILSRHSYVRPALCAGLLLILGAASWQRSWVYRNSVTLWSDTLAKNPACGEAYNNLGAALSRQGQLDKATALFQKALKINPKDARAYFNLGDVLFKKGEMDAAAVQFQKTLEVDPAYAEACVNLGTIFFKEGQTDEAIAQYQRALQINPHLTGAYDNFGKILSQTGQPDQAMIEYQKALEINPNYAQAYYDMGNILVQKGEMDKALAKFQKAAQINPNYVEAHNNVGWIFLREGQAEQAILQFQETLRLNPNYPNARDNLAKAEALVQQKADQK